MIESCVECKGEKLAMKDKEVRIMFKEQLVERIKQAKDNGELLFIEELNYAKKQEIIDEKEVNVLDTKKRFFDSYIERGDKETENFLGTESASEFFEQPITYFKQHINEFVYVESVWFDQLNVESLSFEVDDLFRTYDCLIGLKQPKKKEKEIKAYFMSIFTSDEARLSPMFNQKDGLWEINFTLDYIEGFSEDMKIGEAFSLIYKVLFDLIIELEG